MSTLSRCALATLAALACATLAWPADMPALTPSPQPSRITSGVWLIPGGIAPNREPDGNSVLFAAPEGWVVMDTGRHVWHRQAILDFVHASRQPLAAIVNSHWHLDHVSGNPTLRAAFPALRVYASNAINDALTGFLADSARDSAGYLDDQTIPADTREDIRNDLATVRTGAALKPDVPVRASGVMTIAGRRLNVNLAPNAATAGDVWLYDPRSGVAAVGDLVTLPAPFLDTACPEGWLAALAQISATPFTMAIPGHGLPMTRAQFADYSRAFGAFISCANSGATKTECAAQWTAAVQPLLAADPKEPQRASGMAAYYVDLLRANGGRSKYCATPPHPH
jgi:glyoxylase-like metal-dependent hydrolase (beta-lactamase superfamily II)